ncbi:hypothetical protein [Arthrobacter sp. S39]|uniref:hypothetical protein n=1 Tax=Arthrobacter sp. S39 TaxID=2509720 RepID=UPI001036F4DE|nr:hypothetical protein [Arthrobacter sp. S39]TAP45626.1 hypothetical protein EYS21_02605 [Arthrobacter sp. S39]
MTTENGGGSVADGRRRWAERHAAEKTTPAAPEPDHVLGADTNAVDSIHGTASTHSRGLAAGRERWKLAHGRSADDDGPDAAA